MYESYFGMKCNPFKKGLQLKNTFETNDFKETQGRLKYLLNTKGIGLITGTSGLRKNLCFKIFCRYIKFRIIQSRIYFFIYCYCT